MTALAEYLRMGGYAGFVWAAYGIALVVLGGVAVMSWGRYRASRDALGGLAPRSGARR